jgi:hypothetical protein
MASAELPTDAGKVKDSLLRGEDDAWRTMRTFLREFTGIWERRYNRKGVAEYLWDFFTYEAENSAFQSLNDVAERILQRKPMTLRAFFQEHRALIC